jgi:hypothetical protein
MATMTFTRCWLDQILHNDRDRYTEGALALLSTLSTKLEYLDLGLMELGLNLSIVSIVRRVLSAHWQNPDDNKADYPFAKLKELNMNTNGRRVLVLPSMTTMRADGLYGSYTDDMFRTPYGFQNSFANLRVLKFEYMEIAPASVGGLLPHLRQLKQLRVCNIYNNIYPNIYPSSGSQHNFKLLGQAFIGLCS